MTAQPPATTETTGEGPDDTSPVRRWIWPILLLVCAPAISQGFVRFVFGYVMPDITRDVLGSYSVAGLFSATNLGGYLVGVLMMTSLVRRFESTRLLKFGLALTGTGLVVVAVAPSTPLLFVGMGMAGLCSAMIWIPLPAIVAGYVPPRHRGLGFGIATAGIGVSIALTSPAVTLVQRVFGAGEWRPAWALGAIGALVVLILYLVLLAPVGTGRAEPSANGALRDGFPGRSRLLVSYFLYGVSFVLFTNYLIVALREDLGFTPSGAAQVFSLLGVASIVGGAVGGRASDWFGRRFVMAISMVLLGLLALVVPLGWGGAAPVIAFFYGLLMTAVGTVLVAYLGDVLSPGAMGVAFGSATVSLGLAQLLAPPVGGWLADVTGSFAVVFLLACGAGVLAGLVAVFLPRTSVGRRR